MKYCADVFDTFYDHYLDYFCESMFSKISYHLSQLLYVPQTVQFLRFSPANIIAAFSKFLGQFV